MKTTLLVISIFSFFHVYAQDKGKIKQIDELVKKINTSGLPIQRDTINQDYSSMGMKMKTYLSMILNEGELFKYVNHVESERTDNGKLEKLIAENTFYYHQNKLIKVEEYALQNDEKIDMIWYFWDEKLVHSTSPKPEKNEERANTLLTVSKAMLKQIVK